MSFFFYHRIVLFSFLFFLSKVVVALVVLSRELSDSRMSLDLCVSVGLGFVRVGEMGESRGRDG